MFIRSSKYNKIIALLDHPTMLLLFKTKFLTLVSASDLMKKPTPNAPIHKALEMDRLGQTKSLLLDDGDNTDSEKL
jgi:hypothetical protein